MRRYSDWRWAAGVVAIALAASAVTLTPLATNDLWVHLAAGRDTARAFAAGHGIPAVERFSFTAEGRPLVPHEWLSQLAFYGAWTAGESAGIGGAALIEAMRLACVLAIVAGLMRAGRIAGASPAAILWTLVFLLAAITPRLLERPYLFSWVLGAWWLAALARDARCEESGGWRGVWLFVPVQVVWANLHGGFFIGSILGCCGLAGALAERFRLPGIPAAPSASGESRDSHGGWRRLRRLALALGCGLAASAVINPAGPALLLLPFELAGSETVTSRVLEWRSPFETAYWNTLPFALAVLWAVLLAIAAILDLRASRQSIGVATRTWTLTGLAVAAVFGALALRQIRSVADFVVFTAPWMALSIDRLGRRVKWPRLRDPAFPSAVALAGALGVWAYGYPIRPDMILRTIPPFVAAGNDLSAAVRFIRAQGWLPPQARLFNSYTFGGPLAFGLDGRARVLIDSRNEAYGEALNKEILESFRDPEAFRAQIEKRRPDLLVLAWRQLLPPVAAELPRLSSWKLVFLDDFAAAYAPREVPVEELRFIGPAGFDTAAIGFAEAAAAEAEGRRLLGFQRESVVGSLVLGRALLVSSRPTEAREVLEACARMEPDSPALWILLASARAATGDAAGAQAARGRAKTLALRVAP